MDPIKKAIEDHEEKNKVRCGKCKVELPPDRHIRCEKCGPIWPV